MQKQKIRARIAPDKKEQFGPPDRSSNFVPRKRSRSKSPESSSISINVDNPAVGFIPSSNPKLLVNVQE